MLVLFFNHIQARVFSNLIYRLNPTWCQTDEWVLHNFRIIIVVIIANEHHTLHGYSVVDVHSLDLLADWNVQYLHSFTLRDWKLSHRSFLRPCGFSEPNTPIQYLSCSVWYKNGHRLLLDRQNVITLVIEELTSIAS